MTGLIFSIIIIVIFVILGIFILFKGSNKKQNLIFFIFILSSAFWTFSNSVVDISTTEKMAKLWSNLTLVGPTILPIFLMYFTLIFPGECDKKKKIFFLIPLTLFAFFILIFIPSDINIKSVKLIKGGVPDVETGVLYIYFSIYFIISMLLCIYNLLRSHHYLKGYKKLQIKYILVGIIITFILGIFTNLILLQLGISRYANLGPYFNVIFIGFTVYAIVKYRLMDIRLVISKSILYFFLILFVALSFTFVTFSTAQFFKGQGQVAVTLVVSLFIVIFLDPLKKLLAKWTDKFFYKGKIDFQKVLRDISEIIAAELDLEKLLSSIESNLASKIKVKYVRVLLAKNEGGSFSFANLDDGEKLNQDSLLFQYIQDKKAILITEELVRQKADLKSEAEKEEIDKLEAELDAKEIGLVVPIMTEGKMPAIFLIGQKLSGSPFTQEEINFFDILAPQAATALEKSKLYEEVQEYSISLQEKVRQATSELAERNRYLSALQRLTNVITRSLDFNRVMQTIANGISTEMGYIGGILSFIDFEKRVIRISAISNTNIIQKALTKIPQDPKKYEVSLDSLENSSIRAIKNKEVVMTNNFHETVAPALPYSIAFLIQKLAGIKTIVSVPVYSEEKVIGVIDFILAKGASQITNTEREMMRALADQAGIVSRNLHYYQEIQKANEELKQANLRLQQLDKAKSEFLSIASHQLRTPLTGIKGYLSMIVEGDYGKVPPQIAKILEEVFLNTDRLTRLINIFLNVSRIESGRLDLDLKEMDIVKLTEEVMAELKPVADQRQLALNLHRPKQLLPQVKLDHDKIKDVILNLVDNAIKYTPAGQVDVFITQENNEVKVSIKDTGVGIDKSEVDELFGKFVRGSGIAQIDTSGSGLGLYIAKKIVEAHNGKIWAESEGKGLGATFSFTLPIS